MGEAEILFANVSEVAEGRGTNLLTGKPVKVPVCDVLAAGTSCIDLSSMKLGITYIHTYIRVFGRSLGFFSIYIG